MLRQALNNMAAIVDKKVLIIEAGALEHYVELLSPQYDTKIREAAANGLWTLAFECRDRINVEPGCRDGSYYPLIPRLHDEAGSTSWLYERTTCARRALVELARRALVERTTCVRSSCARRASSTSARRAHVVRS